MSIQANNKTQPKQSRRQRALAYWQGVPNRTLYGPNPSRLVHAHDIYRDGQIAILKERLGVSVAGPSLRLS